MNDIQSFLTEALPSLSSNKISEVCELLSTIGFKQVEDLSYVEPENDLKTCLNTLQCRILKKKLQLFDLPARQEGRNFIYFQIISSVYI